MPSTLTLEMMRIDNKDYYHETSHFSDYCRPFHATGLAQADSAYGSLQAVHEKNTVMKDLRKICTPARVAI